MVNFNNDWDILLQDELSAEYYKTLRSFLKNEYSNHTVYPDMHDIFNAYKLTAYKDVKAVIIGQDPYHGVGQAHGLAFSVREGVQPPPSLVNIFKELRDDLGISPPQSGDLSPWARSGVMLLNAVLTVRSGMPGSHRGMGWEAFTDNTIGLLNKHSKPIVFLLWGNYAKAKAAQITNPNHLILTAPHPSPLSAYNGFFGCRHFSKTNEFLEKNGDKPIIWKLEG